MNVSALMGLSRFDSDDDDEGDMSHLYTFSWRPKVSLRRRPPKGPWGVRDLAFVTIFARPRCAY